MWPINLSVRLPIVGLVGRYLTNYLIGREAILQRINPLVGLSCGIYAICGISVRFQTLSPMLRQVAHALLTRPPLSYLHSIRRLPSNNSVRLECVMHAASVHPEPGSNSRSIVLKSLPKKCSNLSSFFLASFTFCLSSILLRISNEISFALYFFRFVLLQSLVVQFSMTN